MPIKNNESDQKYKAHALQTEFLLKGLLINQVNNQNIQHNTKPKTTELGNQRKTTYYASLKLEAESNHKQRCSYVRSTSISMWCICTDQKKQYKCGRNLVNLLTEPEHAAGQGRRKFRWPPCIILSSVI